MTGVVENIGAHMSWPVASSKRSKVMPSNRLSPKCSSSQILTPTSSNSLIEGGLTVTTLRKKNREALHLIH
jgi:hypothetical protein